MSLNLTVIMTVEQLTMLVNLINFSSPLPDSRQLLTLPYILRKFFFCMRDIIESHDDAKYFNLL